MDILISFFHTVLHLDQALVQWTQMLGPWIYVLLFTIIFAETGLVLTPFLPGDSLLFAVGAVSALDGSALEVWSIWFLLILAAVAGDNLNYWLGRGFGSHWLETQKIKINRKYLNEAQLFYQNYGARTVILARFLPIVRTFAPFSAGLAKMDYRKYISMSCLGSLFWMSLFIGAGYKFGNITQVKTNFHIVILAVVAVSFAPVFYKLIKIRIATKN